MTTPISASPPTARARGRHLVSAARAVAPLIDTIVGPHTSVALATLAVRGSQGRTPEAFALAYGIEIGELSSMESGHVPAQMIPGPLLVLTRIGDVLAQLRLAQEGSEA